MKALPIFIFSFVLLGIGVLTIIEIEPKASASLSQAQRVPQRYRSPESFAAYSAPSPEIFNREIGGPVIEKAVMRQIQPVRYQHGYRQQSGCGSCQQQYACNGCYGNGGYYGNGGTLFYGWNGNGFPVARAGLRIATFPVRAWLAWAPIRRLFGRC